MEVSPILALENDDNIVLLAVFCFYKKVKLSCEPKKGPRAGFGSEATFNQIKFAFALLPALTGLALRCRSAFGDILLFISY